MSFLKYFSLLFLFFFLTTCSQKVEINKKEIIEIKIPNFIVINNKKNQPLGKAFLVKNDIWITPDHLYEKTPDLYVDGEKINILARDFEYDILAFSLIKKTNNNLELSNTPPEIGKDIYWFDKELKKSKIISTNNKFSSNYQNKKNLISFSGITTTGASGSVVFDDNGIIWGMIVGANNTNQKIFAVRSDNILKFIKNTIN
jgi:hypothetical protein